MATDTKSLKILRAIYELDENKKEIDKITKEIMVVKAWEMFPSDFSMKGYPQYPNADISKYITALFRTNFLKGGFHNYKITEKGKNLIEKEKLEETTSQEVRNALHKTIRKVGNDIDGLKYNTAVSEMMKFMNVVKISQIFAGRF